MFKRIALFVLLNFCIVISLSLIIGIFGLYPRITAYGYEWKSLAVFCLVWGMGGAFISLALSRKIAKWMLKVKIVDDSHPLKAKIRALAARAHLKHVPEVGIFESNMVNAFATGPTQKRSLIAVSSKLLETMEGSELDAVLGHEMAHIKNGDMVTMTLLQGVVNAFVMFLARIIASFLGGGRDRRNGAGAYFLTVWLLEVVFMVFGAMVICFYSRRREYRADIGGARFSSRSSMIAALKRLGKAHTNEREAMPQSMRAMMIRPTRATGFLSLFATHPPIEERVRRLEQSVHDQAYTSV